MPIPKTSEDSPYYYGSKDYKTGSGLAEFNNNPGNIMYHQIDWQTGKIQKGKDGLPRISAYAQSLIDRGFKIEPGAANEHGVFIKFENPSDGLRAKSMWWNTVKGWQAYKGKTLDEALLTYSGGGYDSKNYYKDGKPTGPSPMGDLKLDGNKLLSDYSTTELDSISVSQLATEDSSNYRKLQQQGLISKNEDTGFSFINIPKKEVIEEVEKKEITPETIAEDIKPTPIVPGTTIDDEGIVTFPEQTSIIKLPTKEEWKAENEKEENNVLVQENKDQNEINISGETSEQIEQNEEQDLDLTGKETETPGVTELTEEQKQIAEEERIAAEKEAAEEEAFSKSEIERVKKEQAEQYKQQTQEEEIVEQKTKNIAVLDSFGNEVDITVPDEVTPEITQEEVTPEVTQEDVIIKEEITKPISSDFENPNDYMKARMNYYKSIKEEKVEPIENVVEEVVPDAKEIAPVVEETVVTEVVSEKTLTNKNLKDDSVINIETPDFDVKGYVSDVEQELEAERKANLSSGKGDSFIDNEDYIKSTNTKVKENTIQTLSSKYLENDFTKIIDKDDWMGLAIKSKENGGLGLDVATANQEWLNTSAQFNPYDKDDYSKAEKEVNESNKIIENVLTSKKMKDVKPGIFEFKAVVTEKFDLEERGYSEEDKKVFKRAILNAIPENRRHHWLNIEGSVVDLNMIGGRASPVDRERLLAIGQQAVLNVKMKTLNNSDKILGTRIQKFDTATQKLVDDVDIFKQESKDINREITSIKADYGVFKGNDYNQIKKFSEADKARLEKLYEKGRGLNFNRTNIIAENNVLVSEKEALNISIEKSNKDREDTFAKYMWNNNDNVFDPYFKTTIEQREWNESIKKNFGPAGDVVATISEEIGRLAILRAAINTPTLIAATAATAVTAVMDLTSEHWADAVYEHPQDKGSFYHTGMLWDIMGIVVTPDFLPTTADTSGQITNYNYKKIDGDGWWGNLYEQMAPGWAGGQGNWTAYSTSKTFAQLLPYTLNIMSAYRGTANQSVKAKKIFDGRTKIAKRLGVADGFGKKIVNSLNKNWLTSQKMMGSLNMIRINHKMTFFDNYADGRARGLDAPAALTYGNLLSLATGISQTIMPDYNWINTSSGKKIVNKIIGSLKEGSYKVAGKQISEIGRAKINKEALKTFSANFIKEHIEEQTDVLFQDVVKSMFIAGHSPDILKTNVQAEVLSGTTVLTLPIGSVGALRSRNQARNSIYAMFEEASTDIIESGNMELRVLKEKLAKTNNTSKGKALAEVLESEIKTLEANIKEAEYIYEAQKASPKNVTDEQVSLLVEKQKLNERKKELNKKDKSLNFQELEEINNEISSIDEKIKTSGVGDYQVSLYNKLLENALKLAPKLGIGIIEDGLSEEDYQNKVELEMKGRRANNREVQRKIDKLEKTKPKSKKDKKAKAKRIKELENQKKSLTRLSFDGPGMIEYDHSVQYKGKSYSQKEVSELKDKNKDLYDKIIKDGTANLNHKIFIRPGAAKWSGNNAVVLHEMLHVMLYRTMKNNPKSLRALSYLLRQEFVNNPEKYKDRQGYTVGKFDQYKFEEQEDGRGGKYFDMQFDEMFTVFIEALAQGNLSVKSNVITEIQDVVRRLFRKAGINFNIKSHQGMVNFLRDFHKEMIEGNGSLSKGMMNSFKDGLNLDISSEAKTQAETYEKTMMEKFNLSEWSPAQTKYSRSIVAKNSSQNVYKNKMIKDDLKISKDTEKIVKENARIRQLIIEEGLKSGKKIIASEDLQNKLVENNLAMAIALGSFAAKNPKIMNLEEGKRISADQFISGYYLQLSNLARTYDASVNEFGQYLNTILPLRYGEVLAAEKAGAVEGSVGLDLVKDIEDDIDVDLTPDDVSTSPSIDTAERLGVKNETKPFVDSKMKQVKRLVELREQISENYNEKIAEEIAELESQGVADLEVESLTVKKAPNLLYKITSKIFGIDEDKLNPKSNKWLANLRKNSKKGSNEVRSAQRAVVQHVQLILSTIFNEGHTRAHKSSGMPNVLLKFGYTKSSKRIGNNFPQYKKPNLSEKDLLEFVGVKKVKSGYEFSVDRNTSAKLLAIASMVDRNISIQAINENLVETGDITAIVKNSIEDGMSKSSKSIYYRKNPELQPIINEKLHIISDRFDIADMRDIKTLKKIIVEVFKGTKVNGSAFASSLLGKTGVVTRYIEMPFVKAKMSFEEFAAKEIKYITLKKGLFDILDISVDKKSDLYTDTNIKLARSRVADFVSTIVEDYQNVDATDKKLKKKAKKKAMQLIYMLEQQHITAARMGNSKYKAIDGTNDLVLTNNKKLKQRDQLYNNARDFRLFINKTLEGTGLELGLTTTENNKIKKDLGITPLTQQKSKNVIEDLIKKVFDFKVRKDEAIMARELVKMQVKFYVENKMISKEELAMHILTFGSNMSTASRRAAYVYGIQEGLLSNGTSGNYIYGDIKNAGKELEYEHGKPHEQLILEILGSALKYKGNSEAMNDAMNESFVDYEVNIITKKMDKTLTASNRKSSMGSKYDKGLPQGWKQRLFNEENFGDPNVGAILSLSGDNEVIGKAHSAITKAKVLSKSISSINVDKTINNGLKNANSINYNKNVKGITVLDFDDTLATSKSKVLYTDSEGNEGTLTAEEFAKKGGDLLAQGYVYDFSEFSKVVDGKVAPLFNKALKLQGKFGPENMFVLTARPADSAPAIFEFLQANGLNIPLKNITGLANSTPGAKAVWIAEKAGEGYNDFYFADDAIQNVEEVKNVLEQLDVKSKVQQARSKSINYSKQFNNILEQTTGESAEKVFSKAKARRRGEDKGKFQVFIPPSAEDFVGLLYSFLSRGKIGEQQFDFFKKVLIEPLNKAYRQLDSAKQAISNDYKQLGKAFPDIRKKLFTKINKDFTYNDAIRVYLWNKFDFKIWGLSESDKAKLVALVEADENLKAFADTLSVISKAKDGYVEPSENWETEDIRVDLMNAVGGIGRKQFFAEFLENVNVVFSEENLNKIEAIYGKNFRDALEDMLYRIENGTNRSFGNNRLVNRFMNWINGSIGTTMFFNSRSAVLQTLSTVNFINWEDNNILAAAKAFGNQKQYWSDFSMIFNSDMLKQRREGRSFDVNANEIASIVSNEKTMAGKTRAALNYLLKIGFLPTQLADSFAIASGGATFYRNRLNKYLTEGMVETEAKEKAFADFQTIAEATQQSARQDMVSQQQASVLGRVILAFQNTPMQYARLMKKAILDLQAGRGSAKSNVSKIIYYGAVQNVIFYSLQTALFAAMFGLEDDDDEFVGKKTERVISGSVDSILRGMGVGGAVISTLKNMVKALMEEQAKPRNRRDDTAVLMEMLNISPPIGIKARQMKSASRTLNWNQDTIEEIPYYNLKNPIWESVSLSTQAVTNVPLARLHTKVTNITESLNKENEGWQRVAMFMGWSKWNLGIKDKKPKSKKSKTRTRTRTRTRQRTRTRIR